MLKSIHFPPSLKKVGNCCFEQCEALEEVIGMAETQIEELGEQVFRGNKMLKSIHFPPTLSEVGVECFADCPNLTLVSLPQSVETKTNTFKGCTFLEQAAGVTAKLETRYDDSDYDSDDNDEENEAKIRMFLLEDDYDYDPDDDDDAKKMSGFLRRFDGFPLHALCHSPSPDKTAIELCLANNPGCAATVDALSNSALHFLVGNPNASSDLIKLVSNANPAAAAALDIAGCLPIHYCPFSTSSLGYVKLLCFITPDLTVQEPVLEVFTEDEAYSDDEGQTCYIKGEPTGEKTGGTTLLHRACTKLSLDNIK